MQQKFQTILFFTFLICVHISLINTLKMKSKFLSLAKQNITEPVPADAAIKSNVTLDPINPKEERVYKNHNKFDRKQRFTYPTDLNVFVIPNEGEQGTDNHKLQYHVHHAVPTNLTSLNDKVSKRFDRAHRRLAEIDNLRKENEERLLLKNLPSKPLGITSIGVLNFKLKHISKQTQNFTIKSVQEFQNAYNKALRDKSSKVQVNGVKYRIKQIGNDFWYGAIVNGGGIGMMRIKEYLLVLTHDINISLDKFARYFEDLKHKFESHKDELRVIYIKSHNKERTNALKKRLRKDKHLYDQRT